MANADLYKELLRCLKSNPGRIILHRKEEERRYLENLLCGAGDAAKKEVDAHSPAALIAACKKCPKARRKKPGAGSGENGVLLLLNPPVLIGRMEREQYREQAATMLRKMMEAIDVELGRCYITSMIKCETDEALTPGAMFQNCEDVLVREIEAYRPRVILVMGEMLPLKRVKDRFGGIAWYGIEHPITLIKNPDLKKAAWRTLQLAGEAIQRPGGAG